MSGLPGLDAWITNDPRDRVDEPEGTVEKCEECDGTGKVDNGEPDICDRCKGKGKLVRVILWEHKGEGDYTYYDLDGNEVGKG